MTPPRLEVAEVIRSYRDDFLEQYGSRLAPDQRRTLDDLADCRTAALGGHVLGCLRCGHRQVAYNSCGNRHCPKCQATAAARWLEARAAELLPVPYFHVVFTLANAFDPLALTNPRVVYWIACPKNFFLPVRILGAVFRGKFLGALRAAFAQGKVRLPGRCRAAARRAFGRRAWHCAAGY